MTSSGYHHRPREFAIKDPSFSVKKILIVIGLLALLTGFGIGAIDDGVMRMLRHLGDTIDNGVRFIVMSL